MKTSAIDYLSIKRLFDIIISIITLVFMFPFMAIIAFFIKNGSSGPVIFSQKRAGQWGRLFSIYKFRTMYITADKYKIGPKSIDDLRITKIGRFLRRSNLDELPQFINVLKGDMSIVGPRPEMPFIATKYNDLEKKRLEVKPGITGLWQINHKEGSLIHEDIDNDLYYIKNRSFYLDLSIVLSTLSLVLKGILHYK